jgi:ABC-type Fe3+/spermidine/putrescine transport system ATPase subunit
LEGTTRLHEPDDLPLIARGSQGGMTMPGNVLELDNVTKRFGPIAAVDGVSLAIRQGEIFTLLGPSGCGKTTTLRLIAGLDNPDAGRIALAGRTIVDAAHKLFTPPNKRNMGMVFQSYAIWPHKTVFENVAYPLRVRGVRGAEVQERVLRVLEKVGLAGFENRRGPELSGGQQQRVALARALVYEPDILLLDEPFSNLDAKLREQMRVQLKSLLREIEVTVVLVTHDQSEALSLSDRVALMDRGALVQIGRPLELYNAPSVPFVRDFFGRTSLLSGRICNAAGDGLAVSLTGMHEAVLRIPGAQHGGLAYGQDVVVSIRPEDIQVCREQAAPGELSGIVESALFLGERYECSIRISVEKCIFAYVAPTQALQEGDKVALRLAPDRVNVWPT